MTDQTPPQPARQPSEVLGPERLDQALLVLVVHRGGESFLSVANDVEDAALGAWMHDVADRVTAGEHRAGCEACASGLPHEHGTAG